MTISNGGRGFAARASGLVNLEPTKVAYDLALCSELTVTSSISVVGLHEYILKLLYNRWSSRSANVGCAPVAQNILPIHLSI